MIATRPVGCSVFLVEDEVMIRMMVADMLEELGHSVAAEAGEIGEAVRLVQSTEFDIAILDVNVNGKVITPVAELITARNRPFIFATGYGSSGLPPGISRPPRPAEAIPTGNAGPGHRLDDERARRFSAIRHSAVIIRLVRNCALERMIQYPRDLRRNREATAYWIPAFAGMTLRVTSASPSALPKMLRQSDRAAAA
jgi:CheY-like chemotaxis protein